MRRVTTRIALALTVVIAAISFATPRAQKAETLPKPAARAAASSPYVKATGAAYGNADAITQDELKVYEYFLASDQLEGRNLPSRGYDIAALYIASHLKEWGVKPGGSTTGTDG